MNEINRILDQMDRAFAGDAWHGPSLESLLDGISAEDASKHPVRGAHSIWELVNHIAAWNSIVRRRAEGTAVEVSTEMDWPPVWETTEVTWQRSLEHLRDCRARLRACGKKSARGPGWMKSLRARIIRCTSCCTERFSTISTMLGKLPC